MNKETAKDYLPLVQALAEGRVIQVNYKGAWIDDGCPNFMASAHTYRIKPEPREIWMIDENVNLVYADGETASKAAKYSGKKLVRYREVLE